MKGMKVKLQLTTEAKWDNMTVNEKLFFTHAEQDKMKRLPTLFEELMTALTVGTVSHVSMMSIDTKGGYKRFQLRAHQSFKEFKEQPQCVNHGAMV